MDSGPHRRSHAWDLVCMIEIWILQYAYLVVWGLSRQPVLCTYNTLSLPTCLFIEMR